MSTDEVTCAKLSERQVPHRIYSFFLQRLCGSILVLLSLGGLWSGNDRKGALSHDLFLSPTLSNLRTYSSDKPHRQRFWLALAISKKAKQHLIKRYMGIHIGKWHFRMKLCPHWVIIHLRHSLCSYHRHTHRLHYMQGTHTHTHTHATACRTHTRLPLHAGLLLIWYFPKNFDNFLEVFLIFKVKTWPLQNGNYVALAEYSEKVLLLMMQPVTLVITSGMDPSLSALPRCLPPAPSAHALRGCRAVSIPGLLLWVNGLPSWQCRTSETRVQLHSCWKNTSGVGRCCVVSGSPEAWVCTGIFVRGQLRRPAGDQGGPPPICVMVLLSDDPKGCEHGELTSQSSLASPPWC